MIHPTLRTPCIFNNPDDCIEALHGRSERQKNDTKDLIRLSVCKITSRFPSTLARIAPALNSLAENRIKVATARSAIVYFSIQLPGS
jgi:hypothetical protein